MFFGGLGGVSTSVIGWVAVIFLLIFCRSPPCIPEVHLPEKLVLQVASALCVEINSAYASLRSIATGKDLKKFLMVCFLNISHIFISYVSRVSVCSWSWSFNFSDLFCLQPYSCYVWIWDLLLSSSTLYGHECVFASFNVLLWSFSIFIFLTLTNYKLSWIIAFGSHCDLLKFLVWFNARLLPDCGSCQLWGLGAISWPCFIYVMTLETDLCCLCNRELRIYVLNISNDVNRLCFAAHCTCSLWEVRGQSRSLGREGNVWDKKAICSVRC